MNAYYGRRHLVAPRVARLMQRSLHTMTMMRMIVPLLVLLAEVLPAIADAVDVVPEGYEDAFWHNATIGGLFIALYTYGRFNTPPTSRSSTTALRYYIGVTMYVLSALAVY